MRRRPFLFMDVDGVLIPFGVPRGTTDGASARAVDADGYGGAPVGRIRPGVRHALADLPYQLVWATTWGAEANGSLAGVLGLPSLPVVEWPDLAPDEERDVAAGRHWKTRLLVAWADGRPFAWIDDEITDRDRYWVACHHPAPALLHAVDPAVGVTDDDIDLLTRWTATLDAT